MGPKVVEQLFGEEVFPVCSAGLCEGPSPLREPGDLRRHTLLHVGWDTQDETWPDWRMWLLAAGAAALAKLRGYGTASSMFRCRSRSASASTQSWNAAILGCSAATSVETT